MNRTQLAFEFIAYGVLLAGLGFLTYRLAPNLGSACLVTGLASGGLSLLWGMLLVFGYQRRWWIVLTLAGTLFVLLWQMITLWLQQRGDEPPSKVPAILATLMFAISIGTMLNLLHGHGRTYDREGEPDAGRARRP